MSYHTRVLTAAGLVALLGCGSAVEASRPRHVEFEIGMSRSVVVERFGPPQRVQTLHKSSEAIWGEIEAFWSEVPRGSTAEVWSYPSTHEVVAGSTERAKGTTELYFIDGSELVQGRGFAMEGVVYEATP